VKIEEWSDGELEEVRHIIWDGLERVERKNAALQTVRRYFSHGFQTVNGGTTTKYFYSKDHLGSIRTVTNLAGQTVETLSYEPWGRRQNSTGTPLTDFGYTGHYTHSQSNLILAPYRTYDPQTTRWLSRDPIAENGGINLYGYVGNNPINLFDLLGMQGSAYNKRAGRSAFPNRPPDWHRNRNRNNNCPKKEPKDGTCSEGRKWERDLAVWGWLKGGWGGNAYRSSDGSECVYDGNGNILPDVGTFNYEPSPRTFSHVEMDVIPHYRYNGGYTPGLTRTY
jgi:RHS repeat-associated protein